MFWTIIIVALFLIAMVTLGYYGKKLVKSSQDFLLAGRNLSQGINMMAVVAAGFAGTTIALAPAFNINFGAVGSFMFALSYAIVGIVLYGFFFAKTIRRSGAHTLAEWLDIRFDRRIRRILSILGLVGMIAVTANNVLALANVITGYFNINLYWSIAIGVITFMLFTYLSGMWGVSLTDFAQALIGCVGAPLLLIMLITHFGGLSTIASSWPNGSWLINGVAGNSMPTTKLTYPSMLTFILNLGIFLVWGGQHYWLRIASARNEKQAQNAYAIAGIFLFMITVLIGIVGSYAGAFFGKEFTNMGGTLAPTTAYGFVISKFPPAAGSFLLLFALAASLSTAATCLIAAVNMGVRDVYKQFINKKSTDKQTIKASRIITVIISLLAWGLAYYPGGTTFLFAFATAWWAPAGLLFALGMLSNRITKQAAMTATVIGTVCLSLWAILDLFKIPVFAGKPIASYVHMSVVGLVTIIIPAIVVSFFTKPKYYGDKQWQSGRKYTTVTLDDNDKLVMRFIQQGLRTNAEIMDNTGWQGEVLNLVVEKIDEANYIKRDALRGKGFWSYRLTDKGTSALPALSANDAALQKYDLCSTDLQYLKTLSGLGKQNLTSHITRISEDQQIQKDIMSSFVKMSNLGYLEDSGFIIRSIMITANGEAMLQKLVTEK